MGTKSRQIFIKAGSAAQADKARPEPQHVRSSPAEDQRGTERKNICFVDILTTSRATRPSRSADNGSPRPKPERPPITAGRAAPAGTTTSSSNTDGQPRQQQRTPAEIRTDAEPRTDDGRSAAARILENGSRAPTDAKQDQERTRRQPRQD